MNTLAIYHADHKLHKEENIILGLVQHDKDDLLLASFIINKKKLIYLILNDNIN